jgi:hypothetical protein
MGSLNLIIMFQETSAPFFICERLIFVYLFVFNAIETVFNVQDRSQKSFVFGEGWKRMRVSENKGARELINYLTECPHITVNGNHLTVF